MISYLSVGIGGAFGCCVRFALTQMCSGVKSPFPLGTLASNVIAGLLIGIIIGIESQKNIFNPLLKLFLTTGMLGGLSTFSTFSAETIGLFTSGKNLEALLNVSLNLGLSLAGVVAGIMLGKMILSAQG